MTCRYFDSYTKDEVLLAGKKVFGSPKAYEYMIDSYRDRIEVADIKTFLNVVWQKDYNLSVDGDNCGTMAMLTIKNSYGEEKIGAKDAPEDEHKAFWVKLEQKLKTIEHNATSDINCTIEDEFSSGVKRDEGNIESGIDVEG